MVELLEKTADVLRVIWLLVAAVYCNVQAFASVVKLIRTQNNKHAKDFLWWATATLVLFQVVWL